tara:strand:+ start:160 stop:765 length:606 start_codon:yes stop_codon:yes gene_type:complete
MALNFANNNSLSSITAIPASISGGGLNLISSQTASNSSSLSFTTGIDSTYKEYIFKFYNIHAITDTAHFSFNMSIDSGSNYNVTKTTTAFRATQDEAGSFTLLGYDTNGDLAQGTGYQPLTSQSGNENDESMSGTLHIFEPSSSVFVKHFMANINYQYKDPQSVNYYYAGYANTTSTVNAVDFKFTSGNIDSGVIKLYGVS